VLVVASLVGEALVSDLAVIESGYPIRPADGAGIKSLLFLLIEAIKENTFYVRAREIEVCFLD